MGNTWGMLIPLTILMARLRNKKGWWFQLHRALAVASLFWVVVGVILGRRLRVSHPPVTTAGKVHKLFGYTALTFICLQVSGLSELFLLLYKFWPLWITRFFTVMPVHNCKLPASTCFRGSPRISKLYSVSAAHDTAEVPLSSIAVLVMMCPYASCQVMWSFFCATHT